jgi:hypothetical protein
LVQVLAELAKWYDRIPAPLKGALGAAELLSGPTPSLGSSSGRGSGRGADPSPRRPSTTTSTSKTVNVTVINGKQEKAVDSAALALRLAKATGGYS